MTAKRAAIYCRISSDREGRELGVECQQEDCRALLDRLGHRVVEVFVDNDISASTRSKKPRPNYQRMLDAARAGRIEVIAAYTSSRITRRPRENEDLIELAERHGVEFAYVRSPTFDLNSAHGRLVARILAANDAAEAEAAQERIVRAKLQAASTGEWRGGRRPFDFEADGITIRPDEAAEIARASEALLHGASLNGLANDLNARNVRTSTGALWTGLSIGEVLSRARNAGLIEAHGKVVGAARWEPVVPERTWRAVVAVLSDPARRSSPGPAPRWLGSGLYLCFCGKTVRVTVIHTRTPKAYHTYTCKPAKHLGRIAHEVDRYVGQLVVERLERPDAIDLLSEDIGADPTEAITQLAILRGQQDELAEMFVARQVTGAQLAKANAMIEEQIADLEKQIGRVSGSSVLEGIVGADDVAAVWKALPLDRKKAVVRRLFTVELGPSRRGRRPGWKSGESYFDASTVAINWRA